MLKVLFFDASNTLIHLPVDVSTHYARIMNAHGIPLGPDRIKPAFVQAWNEMPLREPVPGPRPKDDRDWWRDLVDCTLANAGHPIEAERLERMFDEIYRHFESPGVWELFPEVPALLEQLSRRFRLGVISNFDNRLLPVLEHLGVAHFFESIIVSSQAGADKPHREIFELALARFGVSADEAMHIGDHPEEDWEGAEAAGLRVFRLTRPANDLTPLASLGT